MLNKNREYKPSEFELEMLKVIRAEETTERPYTLKLYPDEYVQIFRAVNASRSVNGRKPLKLEKGNKNECIILSDDYVITIPKGVAVDKVRN